MHAIIRIGTLCLLLCVCWGEAQAPQRDTTLVAHSVDPDEPKPLVHFGIISRYNPVLMYEEFQPLMDYLTRHTPYKFELKLGRTYVEAVRYLEEGVTQIASLGAVTYLEAHARFGAVPILRSLNAQGEPYYRSIIVVRKDSSVMSLSELRGRSFCFPSPHSTAGNLFGRFALEDSDVPLQSLSRYTNLRHHDDVCKAVLAGEYDAGAVKDIVAQDYEPKGLRFLHVSDPIPSVPIVVRRDASPALVAAVEQALLQLDPSNPNHRQSMANWNEEARHGFVAATDADYEPVRAMLNSVPERCGGSCHPPLRF